MSYLFMAIGWFIGVCVGSFFLIQPMIVLFFGVPTTLKMRNQGIITNANRIVLSYLISFFILGGLFVTSVWLINNFFSNLTIGFWVGIGIAILLGFNKIGKSHNMPEFIEKNMRNIDTNFLLHYNESVKNNHPSSKARDEHIAVVTKYVVADIQSLLERDKQMRDEQISDSFDEVVSIAMRLYTEKLEEYCSETIIALSSHWNIKNIEEHTIKKELFIAFVTLELTSLDNLFQEQAIIIRRSVTNHLINTYGNKEYIETLVNDIYYPNAVNALDTFNADEIFNSVICQRLKQPVNDEVILILSKLYGHMMGQWYEIKGIMNEATSQDETA